MFIFLLYQTMYFGIVLSRYIYVDPSIAPSIPNYARSNNFTPFRKEQDRDSNRRILNEMFQQRAQLERMFSNNQQPDGFNFNYNLPNPKLESAPVEENHSESLERQTTDLLDLLQQRTKIFTTKQNGFLENNRRSDHINTESKYIQNKYYTRDNFANHQPDQLLERQRNEQLNFNEKPQSYATSQSVIQYPTANNIHNNYPTPIVKKHVYFHVAPPEPAPIPNPVASAPRKNYKIIFIKTPSQEPNYAARLQLQQAAQQIEEKTLVYVLSKKPEEPQQSSTNYTPSKPEVYFIRYKNRDSSVTDAATSLIEQSIVNGKGNPDVPTSTERYTVGLQESN